MEHYESSCGGSRTPLFLLPVVFPLMRTSCATIMDNIKFHYLYRDGSNYKNWAKVVFFDDGSLSVDAAAEALRNGFAFGELFIARQVQVPDVFLFSENSVTPDDHCFHEFHSVEVTSEPPDDSCGRSIGEFVADVVGEARRGWLTFDPEDPLFAVN
jgi:hypothetical protein